MRAAARAASLAELGIVPYSSGPRDGQGPAAGRSDTVERDLGIRYGDVEDEAASWTLLGRYRGSDGRPVGFWDCGSGESNTNYLAIQFGDWAVLVYDFGRFVSWSRRYASWCVSRSMRADARGSRSFLRSLIGSLAVRDKSAPSG